MILILRMITGIRGTQILVLKKQCFLVGSKKTPFLGPKNDPVFGGAKI